MSIKRTIECYICERQETEAKYGYGWPGWGSLQGKEQGGQLEMCLCPEHKDKIYNYAERLKNGMD